MAYHSNGPMLTISRTHVGLAVLAAAVIQSSILSAIQLEVSPVILLSTDPVFLALADEDETSQEDRLSHDVIEKAIPKEGSTSDAELNAAQKVSVKEPDLLAPAPVTAGGSPPDTTVSAGDPMQAVLRSATAARVPEEVAELESQSPTSEELVEATQQLSQADLGIPPKSALMPDTMSDRERVQDLAQNIIPEEPPLSGRPTELPWSPTATVPLPVEGVLAASDTVHGEALTEGARTGTGSEIIQESVNHEPSEMPPNPDPVSVRAETVLDISAQNGADSDPEPEPERSSVVPVMVEGTGSLSSRDPERGEVAVPDARTDGSMGSGIEEYAFVWANEMAPSDTFPMNQTDKIVAGSGQVDQLEEGQWQQKCEDTGDPETCEIVQDVFLHQTIEGTKRNLGRLLRISVSFQSKDENLPKVPYLTVHLPLGVDLRPGAVIKVDKESEIALEYLKCTGNGCIVGRFLDDTLLRAMSEGEQLFVGFRPWQGNKPNIVPTPLTGFASKLLTIQ